MIVKTASATRAIDFPGRRLLASGLVALALLSHSAVAMAKEKTVAIYLEGADSSSVRDAVINAVPESTTVAESSVFRAALTESGQSGPLGAALEGKSRERVVSLVGRAAAAAKLDGAFVGRVSREKGKRHVVLLWVDKDGTVVDLGTVMNARKGSADAKVTLSDLVGGVLQSHDAGPEEKNNATSEEKPAPAPEASAKPTSDPGEGPQDVVSNHTHGLESRSLFDVEAGVKAAGRQFDYTDRYSPNLRPYQVFPSAALAAAAEIYPLADGQGLLRDVGIVGTYCQSLLLQSSTSGGQQVNSTATSYSVGLRVRIHAWGDNGAIVGVSDAYAAQAFNFSSSGTSLDGQVPSVNYAANRLAVDARIPLAGRFAALGAAGFRAVFDAGTLATRFRSPTANGVDFELGVAMSLVRGWEARLVGDYERYFYSFKPEPGDEYVAGGALDQFYGGRLAVAYVY